jgi:hypothetical protein
VRVLSTTCFSSERSELCLSQVAVLETFAFPGSFQTHNIPSALAATVNTSLDRGTRAFRESVIVCYSKVLCVFCVWVYSGKRPALAHTVFTIAGRYWANREELQLGGN